MMPGHSTLSEALARLVARARSTQDDDDSTTPTAFRPARRVTVQRRGIPIVDKVDRGQQILDNPREYFLEARERASQVVARDMAREQHVEAV
jgi:hypothetical protein